MPLERIGEETAYEVKVVNLILGVLNLEWSSHLESPKGKSINADRRACREMVWVEKFEGQ